MLKRSKHQGHDGWDVMETDTSQRYFVFRALYKFPSGVSREQIVIQRLKLFKGRDEWDFEKAYKGTYKRLAWNPLLNKEISQAIMNCVKPGEEMSEPKDIDEISKELERLGG